MSDLVKEFGEKLRLKRKEAGYSQESFAAYVGIERGSVNIKLETLYKLTNALNCEFEDILPARIKYKINLG